MTRVYLERDGGTYTVDARGHATGSAEMCAAVSCLVFTLAGYLRNADFAEVQEERLEPGDARIVWRGGSDEPWMMMAVGFLQLQESDPERISVTVAEI